jgi:hypothetical protein
VETDPAATMTALASDDTGVVLVTAALHNGEPRPSKFSSCRTFREETAYQVMRLTELNFKPRMAERHRAMPESGA